jgi:hypothetical protein
MFWRPSRCSVFRSLQAIFHPGYRCSLNSGSSYDMLDLAKMLRVSSLRILFAECYRNNVVLSRRLVMVVSALVSMTQGLARISFIYPYLAP